MELRGCTQLNFFTIIKGGEIIKVLNLARGNPKLKLKSIEEIYSSFDSKWHDSLTECPKADRSLAVPRDFVEVKTEVKVEPIEEENGFDIGAMTLRQIKNNCKRHKRKAARSIDLTTVKKENDDHRNEEGNLDLKETLGSLKRKVLMKRKPKKKGDIKCNSISSTTNTIDGRSKGTPANLDLLDVSSKICKPLNNKVEDDLHDYSQLQARSLTFSDDPRYTVSESVKAIEHCYPDQVLDTYSVYPKCDYLVHPVASGISKCDLNQVSYEHLDSDILQNPLISEFLDTKDVMKVDDSLVVSHQPLVSCVSEASREEDMTDIMACDEPTETGLLEFDSSDIQVDLPRNLQPLHGGNPSKVYVSVMAPNSDYQTTEFIYPGESIESTNENKDVEKVVTKAATNYLSEVKCDNKFSSVSCMASLGASIARVEDLQLSILDAITEEVPASTLDPKSYCHNTEFVTNGEASRSLDDSQGSEAKAIRRGVKNCEVAVHGENHLPLIHSVDFLCNVKSAVEDKQSSLRNDAITLLTCSPKPCNAIDQQTGSAITEECCIDKLEQQPPERLFSARKSISPNSKERLRRALNCAEIQDNTHSLSSKEKLFPEKNCVVNSSSQSSFKKAQIIITSKRLEALRTTEIRANSRQILKKGKFERKNYLMKGTVNGPRASSSVPAASVCSSQSCSKNAIAFSQQQMIDTERLALKLLSDLHSMKEMVVDTLTCSTSRHNKYKARVAVENVKKIEEATKKWLSMMSRDCTRFCKIMELTGNNGASSVKRNDEHIPDSEICQNNLVSETKQDDHSPSPPKSTVHKEKKIIFADEAGESLCQVEVL
ncbi:uncharacterized protein LOC110706461 [Chenopodium quinoa]|uniref:Uncharacterized protein n=1 Tax=Chenopodium quinoa TaxID=63459 RepID=A0A803NC72_CHEQI|nr:uncharacterized protein LOC110706461 [Chenopodium quinoa]XP_021740074.1 uncharacterized protein LOC110706461 [Chenopodium quinoa]